MANADVFTGVWTDHSRGNVLGATITLESKWGAQLVSAAAIVVQLTGVALWTLVAFAMHQHRTTTGPQDEFDAQLQVLLRNSAGAESAAWNIFRLGKVWHKRRPRVMKHSATMALLPAAIYVSFIIAGVFVGQISNNSYTATRVLLKGGTCGNIENTGSAESLQGSNHVAINVSTVAMQYARSCYSGGGTASAISCSVYAQPSLDYTISTSDQPCPIRYGPACFNDTQSKPITLTTAVLDSHDDLGINAPKSDRVTIQYQATCAPPAYDFIDEFIVRKLYELPTFGNTTLEYYTFGAATEKMDWLISYFPVLRQLAVGSAGYFVNAFISYWPHNGDFGGFTPYSPLNKTGQDISLFLINPNGITFTNPVEDALFRTADQMTLSSDVSGDARYVPIRNVSVLACGETWQFCNPVKQKCTNWTSASNLYPNINAWKDTLDLNDQQNATFSRLSLVSLQVSLYSAVDGVPSPLLAATYLESNTGSLPLPNGFWRQEVEGWFQAALAKIQYLQIVYVNLPLAIVQANDIAVVDPETPELRSQCSQQRVTAPQQYQNYNLFALIFIAVFGIVIPSLSLGLKFINPRYVSKGPKLLAYQAEGTLQLHRMALEGSGYDGWVATTTTDDIPRTETAQKRIPHAGLEALKGEEEPSLRYPRRHDRDGEMFEDMEAETGGYSPVAS